MPYIFPAFLSPALMAAPEAIWRPAAGFGLLFLLSLLSGLWLSRSGKPLHTGIFTLHKLLALGAVVYLFVQMTGSSRQGEGRTALWVLAGTGLAFLALFISGAFLSRPISLPAAVKRVHQAAPLLAALGSALAILLR
jgi:hypothetical protein